MEPTLVHLVRHGEVDPAWHGRIYGSLDVPLSERGREQARVAAAALAARRPSAVISSGLQRTEAGAAPLRAALALERLDDPELREIDRGAWAGHTFAEVDAAQPGAWAAWYRDPTGTRPPDGESLADLAARVLPRVAHWAGSFPGREVALVVHGWVIRTLVCHALGAPLALAPRLDVRTGDIATLLWNHADARGRLLGFGLTAPARRPPRA